MEAVMHEVGPLVLVCAALLCLPDAGGHAATATPLPLTAASTSPVPHAAPVAVAPAASRTLGERFTQPDQTIEYHFMIQVAALPESDLESAYQTSVVEPLRSVAEVGALGRCALAGYLDSRERSLERRNLIVRVRDGQITIKARAASPAALLDLEACTARKYEIDRFGTSDYSISSEIKFDAGAFDIRTLTLTPAAVWDSIERRCPGVWRQLRPAVLSSRKMEIPGVAHMYGAEARLKHPAGARVREAGITVWFFPPTNAFLVELAFTGYEKDRAELDMMFADLGATLKSAGLLRADQSSKTRQYFAAYFGPVD
jgi:hypothetical protein